MPNDNKRLLLEIDASIREINRRILNPAVTELTLQDLHPVIEMAAMARARYLCGLFDVSSKYPASSLDQADIQRLAKLRGDYEELVKAVQALQTAIEREYLDVKKK